MFENTFWTTPYRVHPNSQAMVADLVMQTKLPGKTTINYQEYSTPVYRVNSLLPKVPVRIIYENGTTKQTALNKRVQQGVPLTAEMIPAAGKDQHIVIIEDNKIYYEFWKYAWNDGRPTAQWGGVNEDMTLWDGVFQFVGGEKWGARATSLSLLGGLITHDDLLSGSIKHIVSFACPRPAPYFVLPALRTDGNTLTSTGIIPAGQVFRLRPEFVIPANACPLIKMLYQALKVYGMVCCDKSGSVNFYMEVVKYKFPVDPYPEFTNYLPIWKIMEGFKWGELEAVQP